MRGQNEHHLYTFCECEFCVADITANTNQHSPPPPPPSHRHTHTHTLWPTVIQLEWCRLYYYDVMDAYYSTSIYHYNNFVSKSRSDFLFQFHYILRRSSMDDWECVVDYIVGWLGKYCGRLMMPIWLLAITFSIFFVHRIYMHLNACSGNDDSDEWALIPTTHTHAHTQGIIALTQTAIVYRNGWMTLRNSRTKMMTSYRGKKMNEMHMINKA